VKQKTAKRNNFMSVKTMANFGRIRTDRGRFVIEDFTTTAEFNFFPAFRQKKIQSTLSGTIRRSGKIQSSKEPKKSSKENSICSDFLIWISAIRRLAFRADLPVNARLSNTGNNLTSLDAEETGDKKIVWELNRHQHFFTLGAAFWLTGDERYAKLSRSISKLDAEQNPPESASIGSAVWKSPFARFPGFGRFIFSKIQKAFTPELFQKALKFLFCTAAHRKISFDLLQPEHAFDGRSARTLLSRNAAFVFNVCAQWRASAKKFSSAKSNVRILDDGVYFEQTSWYQRYTTDFYTHFLILRRLSGEQIDRETTEKLETRLQSALDF
jgi:hypothetical protein